MTVQHAAFRLQVIDQALKSDRALDWLHTRHVGNVIEVEHGLDDVLGHLILIRLWFLKLNGVGNRLTHLLLLRVHLG